MSWILYPVYYLIEMEQLIGYYSAKLGSKLLLTLRKDSMESDTEDLLWILWVKEHLYGDPVCKPPYECRYKWNKIKKHGDKINPALLKRDAKINLFKFFVC